MKQNPILLAKKVLDEKTSTNWNKLWDDLTKFLNAENCQKNAREKEKCQEVKKLLNTNQTNLVKNFNIILIKVIKISRIESIAGIFLNRLILN